MTIIDRNGFQTEIIGETEFVQVSDLTEFEGLSAMRAIEVSDISHINNISDMSSIEIIRIPFPAFHDGRGFSIARYLRHAGFKGKLRAYGALISDQFRYALDCGFDEVEISDEQAQRQPESDWLENLNPTPNYRAKLALNNQ